jgi:ribosomal-protein-alanine N-acetyltransferase
VIKNISFVPLRNAHIPEILEIEHGAFSTPWSPISFKFEADNPHGLSYVALFEGKVIAYICADIRTDEGHILNLAVHHAMRRKGLATFLINMVTDKMRKEGCRYVYLEVRASNTAARRLYEKLGFKEVGRRRLYYIQPVEDAVLMTLEC